MTAAVRARALLRRSQATGSQAARLPRQATFDLANPNDVLAVRPVG